MNVEFEKATGLVKVNGIIAAMIESADEYNKEPIMVVYANRDCDEATHEIKLKGFSEVMQ